jgi:hypothetical protein
MLVTLPAGTIIKAISYQKHSELFLLLTRKTAFRSAQAKLYRCFQPCGQQARKRMRVLTRNGLIKAA